MDTGQTEGPLSPEADDSGIAFATQQLAIKFGGRFIGALQEVADQLDRELTYTITVKPNSDDVILRFQATATLDS